MDKSNNQHQVHMARKRLICISNRSSRSQSPHKFSTSLALTQPPQKCKQPGDHLITALLEKQQVVVPWWERPPKEKGPREGTPLCFCPHGMSLTQNSINIIQKPVSCSCPGVLANSSQNLTSFQVRTTYASCTHAHKKHLGESFYIPRNWGTYRPLLSWSLVTTSLMYNKSADNNKHKHIPTKLLDVTPHIYLAQCLLNKYSW